MTCKCKTKCCGSCCDCDCHKPKEPMIPIGTLVAAKRAGDASPEIYFDVVDYNDGIEPDSPYHTKRSGAYWYARDEIEPVVVHRRRMDESAHPPYLFGPSLTADDLKTMFSKP